MAVGPGRIREFCLAASLAGAEHLYWAGRATLVARPAEIPVYDAVFRAFFGPRAVHSLPRPRVTETIEETALGARASYAEVLRHKSFADLTKDDLEALAELAAQVTLAVPERRTRRYREARRGLPDLRRTLRRSFRAGGEAHELARRRRRRRPRRLILLLDVSRSMSPYSQALAVVAHGVLRSDRRWEAFCFGTRLTRVTRALAGSDPNAALERAAAEVLDWDGGTRIGESVKAFLDRFGHGGLARGAVVVVCSDGLEVGDPELLREQMERLARTCHRVIWLNPLKQSPAYRPLARGMAAALPSLDRFESGHSLAAFAEALR